MKSVPIPSRNSLLRYLPSSVLERMKPRLRAVNLTLRQVLFSAGDKIETIFFPTSGAVSLVVELSGGERIESAIVGSAGLIGGDSIVDGRHSVYTAIVQ